MAVSRDNRISTRKRNEKWRNLPVRIEMSERINCDACLRACPPHFGAIFNHGADVVIIPELCSGCDKCLPACPVDCIYEGGRMFYIHPTECIECALCETICPVDAIRYDDEVDEKDVEFVRINREYFEDSVTGLGEAGGWNAANTTQMDHPLVSLLK